MEDRDCNGESSILQAIVNDVQRNLLLRPMKIVIRAISLTF